MGNSGPFILCRPERISQTGRRTPQRLAGRSGPICLWFTDCSFYCQSPGAQPLGASAIFAYSAGTTAILSPWITGEPTVKIAWLFICGAFIGTSLILWPHEASGALNLGHLFAVVASVLCALTLLLVRRLGRENNIYTLFFYLCLTGALASLAPLMLQDLPILPGSTTAWLSVAAVAVFSVAAQLTINQALVRIPATIVSVIMTVEVPLVAGFGVLYLDEPLGWRLVVGASLIFSCGVGLSLLPSKSTTD